MITPFGAPETICVEMLLTKLELLNQSFERTRWSTSVHYDRRVVRLWEHCLQRLFGFSWNITQTDNFPVR